ncbi:23S rRNA (uracil(1939)-C(5))-methyltransferase RlmD [Hominifimenecus sp. rT4P-3]|uniref:23S rRNA (uracil(1939)-C(5))-methyltransferase RlmD n=1 Tax=Hominifimenecus sp. rT4P-3 TaxID=3242979 RepID=UPI003DA369FD
MEKNQIVTVKIEDMTENGEGIGKVDGYALFLKDAVIGDVVEAKVIKAKKSYGYARVMQVLEPSPFRVTPRCPVAGPCGGCQLQAMSYESQLAFKEKKVRDHLVRIGGLKEPKVLPTLGMENPWEYRNKAQFPVGRDKNGAVVTGFYAARSHRIVENSRCYLGGPVNEEVLGILKVWMKENRVDPYDEEKGRGLVRHVLVRESERTGQVMVCLVINGESLPAAESLVNCLREVPGMTSISYNVNREQTNVILGKKLIGLYGPLYIEDIIGENRYRISPLAFYQVNKRQTEVLYRTALQYAGLTGDETVWDLYCGTGTISLFLARKAKMVYGVEIVPEAIENARENAKLNGIPNAEFFVGKAEEVLPEKYREGHARADVIVVDPPRKGCDGELLRTILAMKPERVVYVSCDSATLARDVKTLVDGGYEFVEAQPVDMFPMGVHVETVVLMSRIDKKGTEKV